MNWLDFTLGFFSGAGLLTLLAFVSIVFDWKDEHQ